MVYLVFSIFCSTLILILFKLFERFGVTNLYAIIANYMVEFSDLDEVWMVVTPHNPLKKKNTLLKYLKATAM